MLAPGGTLLVGQDLTSLAVGAGAPEDPAVLRAPGSITRSLGNLTVLRPERVRRPVAGNLRDAVDTLVRAIRT